MRLIIMLALALFVTMTEAKSPKELEDATVVGTAPCTVHGERLICIVVEKNDKKYAIAGFLKGDDFFARYVGLMTEKGWVTVWKHGNEV